MKAGQHWPVIAGFSATVIGMIAFAAHWHLWDYFEGPLPGYEILLFPGNMTLRYLWHPLLTEELSLSVKLILLFAGQFFVVTLLCMGLCLGLRMLIRVKEKLTRQ